MVQVERKSSSNEQYSVSECPEIVRIPEAVNNSSVKGTALNIVEELHFSINPSKLKHVII